MENLTYPSISYRATLQNLVKYFMNYPRVWAIVLTGSLARGKAATGSCIDMCIFLEKSQLAALGRNMRNRVRAYNRLGGQVCYRNEKIEGGIMFGHIRVDIDFVDGSFRASRENSFDITRDELETTVGNLFVYAVPLWEKTPRYQRLKRRYVPFYDVELRKARLDGCAEELGYKLWKTRWLANRGEYFAALQSLLEAQRIFLQYTFIKERKYPIDYVKWIKEQCSQILNMPSLYEELVETVEGIELSENGLLKKSRLLEDLFTRYHRRSLNLQP